MTVTQDTHEHRTASVFWRYWSAVAVSQTGSAVTKVALPLTAVAVLQASALQVSFIAAAGYLAWIVLGLPAGVIVQRLPLRGTQVAMDLARAVAIGSIPLAWLMGQLSVAHLVLSALVMSFANVLFDVGNSTLLPAIVDRQDLDSRNSLVSGTFAATELGGPSLGGVLVQFLGAVPTLIVDTVSYLVSAVLMRSLPRVHTGHFDSSPRMSTLIREGWRFVTRHPIMRPCMAAATAANFVSGALLTLVPLYLVRDLEVSPALVGLLIATDGAGSLAGAAITPRVSARLGSARTIIVASATGSLFALLMPWGHGAVGMVMFALGNAGLAAATVVFSVCTRTHRQVASPPELLSRVMATVRFASWGAIPVGALVAGVLAGWLGPRAALLIFCVVTLADPLILLLSPVRHRRDLVQS